VVAVRVHTELEFRANAVHVVLLFLTHFMDLLHFLKATNGWEHHCFTARCQSKHFYVYIWDAVRGGQRRKLWVG
jgi:hypothetical protein